ncbi:MAG: hypothetical protein FD170_4001 [Bacteroidetes bacterium]|nr:MAG: hypothetical protein FD170_4001 [Bacteroidota bacterium]
MKRYSLTSSSFTGEVIFVFNDFNLLESFDTSGAQLSEKQQIFILRELPRELYEMERVVGNSTSAKLTELSAELSFEMFWKRYKAPLNSKKKQAENCWKRLTHARRSLAYKFIPIYESRMEPGVAKLYAETYLNSGPWINQI